MPEIRRFSSGRGPIQWLGHFDSKNPFPDLSNQEILEGNPNNQPHTRRIIIEFPDKRRISFQLRPLWKGKPARSDTGKRSERSWISKTCLQLQNISLPKSETSILPARPTGRVSRRPGGPSKPGFMMRFDRKRLFSAQASKRERDLLTKVFLRYPICT